MKKKKLFAAGLVVLLASQLLSSVAVLAEEVAKTTQESSYSTLTSGQVSVKYLATEKDGKLTIEVLPDFANSYQSVKLVLKSDSEQKEYELKASENGSFTAEVDSFDSSKYTPILSVVDSQGNLYEFADLQVQATAQTEPSSSSTDSSSSDASTEPSSSTLASSTDSSASSSYRVKEPTAAASTLTEASTVPVTTQVNQVNAQTYEILVKNVPTDAKTVKIPVWSTNKGQDDLRWYDAQKQADGTWKVTIDVVNHKGDSGLYNAHVYAEYPSQKNLTGLMATTFEVKLPAVTAQVNKVNDVTYEVVVKNVLNNVKSVKIPVWSTNKGQDDLRWYEAKKQADGTWRTRVDIANHKGDSGLYNAHVYAEYPNQKNQQGLTATTFQVQAVKGPVGTLSVTNVNLSTGTFDVVVSSVVAPNGVKSVKIPVWSDTNGQDDLRWYEAQKQADGTYKASISLGNHNYQTGKYNVHAYLVDNSNKMSGIGATAYQINNLTNRVTTRITKGGMSNYTVTIDGVLTTGGVQVAVWADSNGQDDLHWYTARRVGATSFQLTFNAQEHNQTGRYQVHIYENNNGKLRGLNASTTTVDKASYPVPYFSQLDGRWRGRGYGWYNFGATGCVPTVMAMIISAVRGQTILPTDVGDWLYNNTIEFDRSYAGTSSRGVVMSAQHWGLKASALNSYNDLATALQQGYFVAAGVGPSKYIVAGGHEIVLKGYQNGMTYVYDPYNPSNNGWTSLSYIWNVPSTDAIDRTEGMPFLKISD